MCIKLKLRIEIAIYMWCLLHTPIPQRVRATEIFRGWFSLHWVVYNCLSLRTIKASRFLTYTRFNRYANIAADNIFRLTFVVITSFGGFPVLWLRKFQECAKWLCISCNILANDKNDDQRLKFSEVCGIRRKEYLDFKFNWWLISLVKNSNKC